MTQPLESITVVAASLALDAAQLRQQAIAANIANQSTPGFVPLKVSFESQMDQARRDLESRGVMDASSLAGVSPRLAPALDVDGQPMVVHLDEQVAALADVGVRYQALSRALGRHYSILSLAIADGKR